MSDSNECFPYQVLPAAACGFFISASHASFAAFAASVAALAATEEKLNQRFSIQPGGTVVVEVDFGSIDVNTNATSEVIVDVWRKIGRRKKADEEAFLRDNPVEFTQEGKALSHD